MGLHEDSAENRDNVPHARKVRRVPAARSTAAPYAARTRAYYQQLSATSVGLEMAVAVVAGLLLGMWLDRKLGAAPWMMILGLVLGFTTGMRGVWRHVAAADRAVKESEG